MKDILEVHLADNVKAWTLSCGRLIRRGAAQEGEEDELAAVDDQAPGENGMADHKDERSTCETEHYLSYGAGRLLTSLDSLTSEIEGVKDQDDVEFVQDEGGLSNMRRMVVAECFDEDDVKKWLVLGLGGDSGSG